MNDVDGADVQALARITSQAAQQLAGAVDDARERREQARFEARISRPAARSRGWLLTMAGVASAAALVLVFVARDRSTPTEPLTFRTAVGEGSPESEIRFSDESVVATSADAKAWVRSVDTGGARIVIAQGTSRVNVRHRPGSSYHVEAGPFDVQVMGARFAIDWEADAQRLTVSMEEGTVVVRGPQAEAGVSLAAGQRLTASVVDRTLHIDAASAEAPPPVAEERRTEAGLRPPGPSKARAPAVGRSWRELVAAGHFQQVVQGFFTRGAKSCLERCSLDELTAVADAARYEGSSDLAKRLLAAQRARFPRSEAAHTAAFVRGRMEEDAGSLRQAQRWYDRYLQEAPDGTFAPDALGRSMALSLTQGDRAAARKLADEYLRRFPTGAHARAARALMP